MKVASSAPARAPLRVAVLGAGFLGAHICRSLHERRHDVVALVRRPPSGLVGELLDGAALVVGDAGVHASVAEAIAGAAHIVLSLSSLMPGEADENPQLDMSLTLGPLLEVLDQLGKPAGAGVGLTLLSSGGTVYGAPGVFPTPENAPTDPVSSYGITKLTAEKYVLRHAALHGVQVRVLRMGNAYGPGQLSLRGQGAIGAALSRCITGEPFVVYGDGSVARDFVHVADLSEAAASLVELSGGPAVINVASGESVSLNEVLELVQEVTGRTLTIERRPARSFDVAKVQLDISRLRSLVDFAPRSLADGIADTWDHVRAHAEVG